MHIRPHQAGPDENADYELNCHCEPQCRWRGFRPVGLSHWDYRCDAYTLAMSCAIVNRFLAMCRTTAQSAGRRKCTIMDVRAVQNSEAGIARCPSKAPCEAALDSPKTEPARTQIPGDRVTVLYDPALVRVCGGVAAALLFTWFESLFEQVSPSLVITAASFQAIYESLAMRQRHLCHALQAIAVVHRCPRNYQLARIADREFIQPRSGMEVFYSLEITIASGPCIIRRNSPAIERAFGQQARPVVTLTVSPKALAKSDSCRISVTTR